MKTIRDITHSYAEALDAERFPVWEDEGGGVGPGNGIFNDAQMINGSFEGDTISQKGKKILEKRKNQRKDKEKTNAKT